MTPTSSTLPFQKSTQIQTTASPTPAEIVLHFTINFTIINMRFKEDMGVWRSEIFNFTEAPVVYLLDGKLRNTSIGPVYKGCKVTAFRPVRNSSQPEGYPPDTGVDAICTYRNDSAVLVFDRVKVYHELVNWTEAFTKMGPYLLDRYSLYVNEGKLLAHHWKYPQKRHNATIECSSLPSPAVLPTVRPTLAPLFLPFTVNFTITNMRFKEDMGIPKSQVFNFTEEPVIYLLNKKLQDTSIGPVYVGCKVMAFRPVRNSSQPEGYRPDTGVDAICTYRNDSAMLVFDRVKVYHELVNQTDTFTKMGPYHLDRYSLYVNGYHEIPLPATAFPTISPAPAPVLIPFTVNFTITNLRFKEDMGIWHSEIFNFTESPILHLVSLAVVESQGTILSKVSPFLPVRNSSQPDGYRPDTGVDAICMYQNDSAMPVFDRVKVYQELVNRTKAFTMMGPYHLDRYSLYVNGYHETPLPATVLPTVTPTLPPLLIPFTVNFTITNMRFKEDMAILKSQVFNFTEEPVIYLLNKKLQDTSIGPVYVGCKVMAFRPVRNNSRPTQYMDDTGVDAVCKYRNESTGPAFDREKVYHELVKKSEGFTKMGPYHLDRYSLYVDGYHEIPLPATVLPTISPTPAPVLIPFTVNFTITNLRFKEDMGIQHSEIFSFTESPILHLLDGKLHDTSVGPVYKGCKVTAFRPVRNSSQPEGYRPDTGVDAVCMYQNNSAVQVFDRVKIYHELINRTEAFTMMGPYHLDRYSLYVNVLIMAKSNLRISTRHCVSPSLSATGVSPTSSQPSTPATIPFTVNFTITNLRYKDDMGRLNSQTFNFTKAPVLHLLGRKLHQTSISPVFERCEVTAFRPNEFRDDTGVDTICKYRNDSVAPIFDRVKIYHELVNQTEGFTQLGPYHLERYSLYINGTQVTVISYHTNNSISFFPSNIGYNEIPPEVRKYSTQFIYRSLMADHRSEIFHSTETVLTTLFGRVVSATSISPTFLGCKVNTLRPVRNRGDTGMDAVCTYRKDTTGPVFDRVKLYREIVNRTNGFTKMAPYALEQDSFYINGNHTLPVGFPLINYTKNVQQLEFHQSVLSTLTVNNFTANFTVTNLRYRPQMRDQGSEVFSSAATVLMALFGRVAAATSFGPAFLGCKVTSLNSVRNGDDTGTDAVCSYRSDSTGTAFDRVKLYREVASKTNGFTKMGPYQLDRNSLYINGYNEALLPATVDNFTANFTILNLRYRPQMANHASDIFHSTSMVVTTLLGGILNSTTSIGPAYLGCNITALRPVGNREDTGVDVLCMHRNASQLDRTRLYHEIFNRTNAFTKMGPYRLHPDSLFVNGYHKAIPPTGYHEMPIELAGFVPLSHRPAGTEQFTMNFSAMNLRYRPAMGDPGSAIFHSTQQVFATLMGRMFKTSSIGSGFPQCNVTTLRSLVPGTGTGVDSVCSYKRDTEMPAFDRQKVYREVMNQTKGFTKLGPYDLAKSSVYVNGYNEPSVRLGYRPSGLAPDGLGYELGFTILNKNLNNTDPSSPGYQELEAAVKERLNHLFRRSALGNRFKICVVTGLRTGSVIVDCRCYFDPDINISKETVKETLRRETQNGTSQWLGQRFQFKAMSVRAIDPAIAAVTDAPTLELHLRDFDVNFTITNLPFRGLMSNPASEVYQTTKARIEGELGRLYEQSSLASEFVGCSVENLRANGWEDQTGVDAICAFEADSGSRPLDRRIVYNVFMNLTDNGSTLGKYTLDHRSLVVNGYPSSVSPVTYKAGLPFWAIILICLAVLLGFILLFLICCWTNFCTKRRAGKYEIQGNIWNTYFPHLDMQKRAAK
ncbi:hypothetical protein JRQ81_008757 [Phrynocephalus forsythii]|uniref:SEA domain-containing protein n=1 Tax=Phrynocephalus forsythii TaxID=171643 RepID=A0A9Q0XCK6_9SAUR|nr:hypothetical protein JRQ81_008757 [Phrynocephalus forsythii]